MRNINKRLIQKLILLGLLAMLTAALYLFYNLPNRWEYALNNRMLSLMAIVMSGMGIAISTMIFLPIVNNRILTPNILGLDNLYLLIQTTIIFLFGSAYLLKIDSVIMFFASTGIMVIFALLLYHFLFKRENQNIFFLLLVGIVFGLFFQSMTTFMEVMIDPNEFQIAQDIGFASFNNINTNILWWAMGMLTLVILYSIPYLKYLDVLALGREQAINLGINYEKLTKKLLIVVAILTSIATALAGPMAFLGLLVMNLSIEFMRVHKFKWLLMASLFISMIILLLGQWLVTQFFNFKTTLSIIINFIGGTYFIYLLLKVNKKWQ